MKVLVTGGAGYIGSHTVVQLLNRGDEVIIVDNLSNSKEKSVKVIEEISGKKVKFYKADILDRQALEEIFKQNEIESVIHFAGYKAVGESCEKPLMYYYNNITGTLILLEVMKKYGVYNIVFSSSATVYGNPHTVPILENFPLSTTNPYGSTKLFIEYMLKDLYASDKKWNIAILRYFNPVGAHKSGKMGEDPNGIPNNLVPYITKVAIGKLEKLGVFGDDYNTPDGTGVRDYIHVEDLANGHLLAINKLHTNCGLLIVNLGTGIGYSVLDMLKAFSKVVGKEIPYVIKPRRSGDIATCYSNPSYAKEVLGFVAKKNLDDMCEDSWRWQKNNPNGYED